MVRHSNSRSAPDGRRRALSRREREIMDIVFREGRATASEVHARLSEPPNPAAVRTMLRILEEKGHLRHEKDGPRHVYFPVTSRRAAQRSAIRHLLATFFNGSHAAAVAALLDDSERALTPSEQEELAGIVDRLRADGR
jgi:predicted transcriptional regulator